MERSVVAPRSSASRVTLVVGPGNTGTRKILDAFARPMSDPGERGGVALVEFLNDGGD